MKSKKFAKLLSVQTLSHRQKCVALLYLVMSIETLTRIISIERIQILLFRRKVVPIAK
jgi:hypothetical protein